MNFEDVLAELPDGAIAEIGCGTEPTARTTIGIDIDAARLTAAPSLVQRIVADAHALPLIDCALDAIVARGMLHHSYNLDVLLAEARRALRPNGVLLALDCAPMDEHEFSDMTAQLNRAGHASEPRNGIDPDYLATLLRNAGFADTSSYPTGSNWTNATPPFTNREFQSPAWIHTTRRASG